MEKSRFKVVALAIAMLLFAGAVASAQSASLSGVSWNSSSKDLSFVIQFSNIRSSDAWVGIVPAGTPDDERSADNVDVTYKYLSTLSSGSRVSLHGGNIKGDYEVRVYASDSGGALLARERFSTSGTVSPTESATLSGVSWDNSAKDLSFVIQFSNIRSSDAWVGIVPAGTPDDERSADNVDVTYRYLSALSSGSRVSLHAGNIKGDYEVRVYASDNGGALLARTRFSTSGTVSSSDGASDNDGYDLTLEEGDGLKLGNGTWQSSNSSVIKIGKNGKAMAVGAGTATLTSSKGKQLLIKVEE